MISPMSSRANRGPGAGLILLTAAGIALSVLAAMGLGMTRPASAYLRDGQLRLWPRRQQSDQLVLVVLDDASIEQFGRFPWPRADQAGICRALTDAGARLIALDISLHEPQAPRAELLPLGMTRLIFDDQRLAEALQTAPAAILPIHIRHKQADLSAVQTAAVQIARALGEEYDPDSDHIRQIFQEHQLNADQSAAALRRAAAAVLVAQRFAIDVKAPERRGDLLVGPDWQLARSVDQVGFVTLQADSDDITRRARLLDSADGQTFGHFALVLAAEILAAEHGGSWQIQRLGEPDRVQLQFADGLARSIPVDADGQMIIRWGPPPSKSPTRRISISLPARIHANRKAIRENLRLQLALRWRLASELGQRDLLALFDDRQLQDRAFDQTRQMIARSVQPGQVRKWQQQLEQLQADRKRLDAQIETQAAELTDPFYLRQLNPDQPLYKQVAQLQEKLRQIPAANQRSEQLIRQQLDQLASVVAGKAVLIGSSATALGDFVATPILGRMPGMEVHHEIFQNIATGRFLRQGPWWVDLLLVAAFALAGCWLAGRLHVALAAVLVLVLGGGLWTIGGAVLLERFGVLVILAEPMTAMVAGFVVLTAWRQLAEQRQRRRIRGMFAQALSGQLVDRLLENPELAQLGGRRREITVLFSDLQGFTALAERLGEERSVQLLNRYFDQMTEVIQQRHRGYLNKFMGDGILAIFGAPVDLPEHAGSALSAAVDCQLEIEQINRQLPEIIGADLQLRVRIGLATGLAIVGNCGSSQRMDWTAIGDAVNVASRLEGANKYFGTQILVTESNWQQANTAGKLLGRSLGPVRVVGRVEPVRLVHVIGPAQTAGADRREFVHRFCEAMDFYLAGQFAQARDLWAKLAERDPQDVPTQIFLARARQFAEQGPEQIPPVFELSGK